MTSTPGVQVEVVPGRRLDPVDVAAWAALQEADPSLDSPLLRPEFTAAVAAATPDVQVAVVRRRGEAVGFLPFQLRGRLPIGRPVGAEFSDCHGLVAAPGERWRADDLLGVAGLRAWRFGNLLPQAAFGPWLRAEGTSFRIDLSRGHAAYEREQRQRTGQFAQLARKARRLERLVGPLRLEFHTADRYALELMIAWKRARYTGTQLPDYLAAEWARDMLRSVHRAQEPGFAGVLTVLHAGDRPAAIHLGMRSGRVLHSWMPAFDPTLGYASPGLLLQVRLSEAASAMGLEVVDLGPGEQRYKHQLANDTRPLRGGTVTVGPAATYAWRAGRLAMRGLAALPLGEGARDVVHRVRPRLP